MGDGLNVSNVSIKDLEYSHLLVYLYGIQNDYKPPQHARYNIDIRDEHHHPDLIKALEEIVFGEGKVDRSTIATKTGWAAEQLTLYYVRRRAELKAVIVNQTDILTGLDRLEQDTTRALENIREYNHRLAPLEAELAKLPEL